MKISKKLITQTCLPIYKKVIEEGKKDNKGRFLKRLRINEADYGICNLYSCNNKIGDIYDFSPLYKICKVDRYGDTKSISAWYAQIPFTCKTKKEMMECINKRVQLLESWL